jgi:hypothetical protein
MKKTVRQYFVLGLLLTASLLTLVAPLSHAAANNSIYMTPNSKTVKPGDSFTVIVDGYVAPVQYPSSSQVSGTMTFPANLLRVTSVSTAGNPYTVNLYATPNNTNGTVVFNGQNYYGGPNDETIRIMAVTFQALGNGTANAGFTADTKFTQFFGSPNTNLSGGTYTISTPPPPTCPAGQVGTPPNCTTPPPATCPAGQTGTPPNCKTPTPTCPAGQVGTPPNCTTPVVPGTTPVALPAGTDPTIPTVAPEAIAPTQTDAGDLSIKEVVAKINRKENAVTWQTSLANVTTEIQLGTAKDKLTAKPEVTKISDGSYSAVATNLVPGTRYYYTITATSVSSPDKKATYSGAFTTRGYPVEILVTKAKKPVANAKIAIEQDVYQTDKNGKIVLELAGKDYKAVVTLADKTAKSFNFTVIKKAISPDKNPDSQTYTFEIAPEPAAAQTAAPNSMLPLIASIVGGVVLLGGGMLFLLMRRRKAQGTGQDDNVAAEYTNWQDGTNTQPQITPEEQQLSTMASIEQRYIANPEGAGDPTALTDLPAEQIYEAAPIAVPPPEIPTEPYVGAEQANLSGYMPPEQTQEIQPAVTTDLPAPGTPEEVYVQEQPAVENYPAQEIASPQDTAELEPPHQDAAESPEDSEPDAILRSDGELDIIHHGEHPDPQPLTEQRPIA